MKIPYLDYSRQLNGYDYFYKKSRIYRFELYLKGITVEDALNERKGITKRERIHEHKW